MKDWTSEVIDDLCAMKAAGFEFDAAWKIAASRHRPRGRDAGIPADTLFEAAQEAEPLQEFLRRVCGDAWHGRKPGLRHVAAMRDAFPEPERAPFSGRAA